MSGDYLCEGCGGHGGVMVLRAGGGYTWAGCDLCDGRDRVTPLIEAQAESMQDPS